MASTRKGASLPPPVPWYRGRSVVVTLVDGMLRFKPLGRQRFSEISVPVATLVLAIAEDAALGLQGDFASIGHAGDLVIAPLDPDDAQQIETILARRLALPRTPTRVASGQLAALREWTFVLVEGTFEAHDEDDANFEGALLEVLGDGAQLEQGQRYRVLGFLTPARPPESGPVLRALQLTPLSR